MSSYKKVFKLLMIIMIIAIVLSTIGITAGATNGPVMSITGISGEPGNDVTVNVSLTQNSGMAGGNFTVSYDTSKLQVKSVTAGTLLSGKNPTINTAYQTSKIRVTWATGAGAENNAGNLVAITFTVKSGAVSGRSDVILETSNLYDVNAASISHQNVNGYVDISIRTVNFTANGGSPAPVSQQVPSGQKATVPVVMTKSGYIFDGWYTSQDLSGNAYDFNNNVITQNITLYAKWISSTVNVNFDSQGGTAVSSITVSRYKPIAPPKAPTLTGKTFEGWYKEAQCLNIWNFSDPINQTMTLYAKWASINVTAVTLNPRNLNMLTGETSQVMVSYTPDNASNMSVVWASNKQNVAAVSQSGLITAKGAGTAQITATATGSITDSCIVNVKAAIRGKVTYPDGSFASWVRVNLNNGKGDIASAYTDYKGDYLFYADTGSYYVTAVAANDDFQNTTGTVFAVAEGDSEKISNIVMQNTAYNNSSVTINLTSGGNPYSNGYWAYISSYKTNFWSNQYIPASSGGTVTLQSVPYRAGRDQYTVSIYTDDGYWEQKDLTIDAAAKTVSFSVPVRYTVSGTVKTEADVAVPNVSVVAKGDDGYCYWGYTGADGKYVINGLKDGNYTIGMDTWGKYTADPVSITINGGNVNSGTNLTAKLAADLLVNIQKDDNSHPYRAYLTLYKKVNGSWQYVNGMSLSGENALLEGAVKGFGDYKLQLDCVYDSHWVSQSFVSEPVFFTVDAQSDLSQGRVSKIILYSDPTNPNAVFTNDGNLVLTDVDLVRNGSKVNLTIRYKNNGNSPVSADFTAELPAGVSAPGGSGFSVTNLPKGESGQKTIVMSIDNASGNIISIPVKVTILGVPYDFGKASLEVAGVTLNAPGAVKNTDSFKVYGEATEGSSIVIKDAISGKVLGNAKPNGRWFYAQISNLPEGTYKLIAEMTSGIVTVTSQPVTVESRATQITINKVTAGTYGMSELPVNSKIGVPAFSAWVDTNLNGRDISLQTLFNDTDNLITSVTYHFMGKDYPAAKSGGNTYTTLLTGWSGTGLKNITATVTTSDARTLSFIIAETTILIDPSGYVVDQETGKRLTGVTVVCQVYQNGQWSDWDAESYGQVNPQVTDDQGNYGWMVPDGTYRVKAFKSGYADYDSLNDPGFSLNGNSTIIIPPVRTDVNLVLMPSVTISSITLDADSVTLSSGQSVTVSAIVGPNNATNANNIEWYTNNSSVATVDTKGKVTAVSAGSAIITAKIGSYTDACTVTVNYSAVISVKSNGTALAPGTAGVIFKLDNDGTIHQATIGVGGQFTITDLAPGYHIVLVTYNGVEMSNAVVSTNKNATFNFLSGGAASCYVVVYKDWNGKFLKAVTVLNGQAPVYGANPTRNGYTFANWVMDSDTSNDATDELSAVTGNLTVRAKYNASTIGSYTLTRGLIYSNGGLWFNVTVTRNSAAQLNNPLLKVTYTTGSGQVISVIPITVDSSGNSSGNRVFIPNGATNVSVRLVDGDDANWPTAYKSAAVTVTSTQISAGVGN